jgi:hypothetical protein
VVLAALLATLSDAYAPPAPRPAPVRPSPHGEPEGVGKGGRSSPGANREFLRKGWSIGSSSGSRSVGDGLRPSRYLALLDIVRAQPSWSRIDIDNWRLSKEPSGPEEIYRVLELTGHPLPPLELALFLDPIAFKGARKDIGDAWTDRAPYNEMPTEAALLDNFLKLHAGSTLLLVGHVEGNDFIMRDADGKPVGSYSVPDLVSKAREYNVLLVPIGCKTGEAGAPFGFMQNISTDQVQTFLRALPSKDVTIGDLFIALEKIAPLHIDISAARDVLELAVIAPGNEDPSVRVQIPRNIPPQTSSTPSTQTQTPTLENFMLELDAPPWRYLIHDLPWGWISFAGFIVLAIGGYLDEAPSTRWFFVRRSRANLARLLKLAGAGTAWLGLGILLISALYFFTTQWGWGVVIVAVLTGLFLAGAWIRSPSTRNAASAS